MPREHVVDNDIRLVNVFRVGKACVVVLLFLSACSTVKTPKGDGGKSTAARELERGIARFIDTNEVSSVRRELVRYAMTKIGAGYCYAGKGPGCYDCSGFVGELFSHVGILLPRSSSDMAQMPDLTIVMLHEAQAGDIVFFDLASRGTVNHVGMLLSRTHMIHASTSRGVVVDRLENEPFSGRRLIIGRLNSLND